MAGTAASDAACCAALGRHSRGDDHRQAADLLREIVDGGEKAATALVDLINLKDAAVPADPRDAEAVDYGVPPCKNAGQFRSAGSQTLRAAVLTLHKHAPVEEHVALHRWSRGPPLDQVVDLDDLGCAAS